jgi:hypothetical protein
MENNKKEIGGYLELETFKGNEFYPKAIPLDCGRNCLRYLIRSRRIKTIYLPYFMCSVVEDACKKENCEMIFYHIGKDLRPLNIGGIPSDGFLYLCNYFGQISNKEILDFKEQYENLIVDNVQAFFQKPIIGIDTIYTCRKFFGVSDGAYLFTNVKLNDDLIEDKSFSRITFLVGRYENNASDFYHLSRENNEMIGSGGVHLMSKLTHNFLRPIDYEKVKQIRTENFAYLNLKLRNNNLLHLKNIEGGYVYPFWVSKGAEVRDFLIKNKIYIPVFWPNVLDLPKSFLEYDMAKNILALPVDQRYGRNDMNLIVSALRRFGITSDR